MAATDRVGMVGEHNGDRLGRLARGLDHGRSRREDDVDIHAHQFGREFGQLLDPVRPTELDCNFVIRIAGLTQSLTDCSYQVSRLFSSRWSEKSDDWNRLLLRARRERPRRRAANERDEVAPLHIRHIRPRLSRHRTGPN